MEFGAELETWSRIGAPQLVPWGCRGLRQMVFSCQLLLLHEGEHVWNEVPAQETTSKKQGLGSQRQPRPSLAYGDQRGRGEKCQRCFAEQSFIFVSFGSPRRVDVSSMQLSESRFEPWVRWGLRAEVASWFGGIAGACAQKAFSSQLLLLHEGEQMWSGFPAQENTSKAAGPGSQRQPRPSLAY